MKMTPSLEPTLRTLSTARLQQIKAQYAYIKQHKALYQAVVLVLAERDKVGV